MKRFQKNIKLYIGFVALALAASCKPSIDLDTKGGNPENVDFSKYIAVGNSLTAGYANSGLSLKGQEQSFPNMLAQEMKKVGGGEFLQPYFPAENYNGSGFLYLKALVNGQPELGTVTDHLAIRGQTEDKKPLYIKYTGPINNLGVPGMRLDLAFVQGMGALNPYFERLLPDNETGTKKYVDFATTKDHTFFSFSLGNNDVLGYATNGAVTTDATNTLISEQTFAGLYTEFITKLTSKEQKGVVATIPDVTAVPYFTTVTRQALLAGVNAALKEQGKDPFSDIYIKTKTVTRAATDKDMFILPFSSAGLLGRQDLKDPATGIVNPYPYGLFIQNPVGDNFVLDESEAKMVQDRIVALNTTIKQVADSKKLAVADIYSFLNKVKSGYQINGIAISNKYITGNIFSLDGVHLTPMGYAIMANVFVDAINAKYSTKLGKVNVSQYGGVALP
ncbi:G-D-S-L family lipolytic protein [Sphingobacterium puteale]|uniref:G-D-S-L family lipolytic protein n=1 Tax=Sphingobacterium puteale TaxID=2420510 RepID=A0A420W480_9SPHI|nr:SGNH/GDSL hydrolase family protein [Sphingobacterium puteale]RKO73373.1 G-D-S-L family lipolytic protein [Sphingobacterium puteale]